MRRLLLCALAGCGISAQDEIGDETRAVDVTWMNAVGVSTSGNSLTKSSSSTMWDAGAASVETIAGDGYVEFTTAEATTAKMVGLSVGDGGQGWQDIDFAIHLKETGRVGVYEGGVLRGGNFTDYTAGDVLRIDVQGGVVSYAKNGTVFYTSAVAPGSPLGVDTSLKTPGATINDVQLVSTGITWQNLVGVSAAGNDLTKTATTSLWNAGASSVEALDGAGYIEFTTGESTTAKMVGLGNGDDSQHYADIEYAVWLKANGYFGVYESGVLRDGTLGTYAAGDVFRVSVTDSGRVFYSVNDGPPFYTSTAPATFPLRVDTSLYTPGATVQDVRLVAGVAPCVGPFTVTDAASRDAIAACTEIIGELTINAPGVPVVDLPNLAMLRGDLTLWTSIHAAALTEVQGKIFAEPDTDQILLPAVRTAYSFHAGRKRTWTRTIDLSSLETLTRAGFGLSNAKELQSLSLPALRSIAGTFYLDGHESGFTTTQWVDAPLLERVEGSFVIDSHEVLQWIDFSSLTYLAPTGSLEIYGNGMLPNCYATDIQDRLVANGWTGNAYIWGNNGSGTCP
jgi:hypothetical protein